MPKEETHDETADEEIDLEALQNSIDESQIDDTPEQEETPGEEADESSDENFDLDSALDSFEPISLDGKITEDVAIEKATERGWRPDGKDKYGHQISAIEFLERTPLFHKMGLMREDVEDLKKQNKRIIEQNKKIAQSKINSDKKHVEELKAQKEKLLANDELDSEEIAELKDLDKQLEEKA
ncbi:hypothetical protein GOV10_02495, partial [Candidatus Woesearchaeota archaeon]|nr:hypothetical protein [Candidatus Woesearchaeota archaeon]